MVAMLASAFFQKNDLLESICPKFNTCITKWTILMKNTTDLLHNPSALQIH